MTAVKIDQNTQERAVPFRRVSSREQREEGYSIESQRRLDKDYANKRNFKIFTEQFELAESARKSQERKIFIEMLAYVRKNKINIILVEKVDRITRNLKDASMIDDWLQEDERHQIHFIKDNLVIHKFSRSNEQLQWDIKVALARHYSN